jgi:TrmH family RNA methyltransferase
VILPVTSRANIRVKLAAALDRSAACRKKNLFLMEGPKFINDHIARGLQVDFVVLSDSATGESKTAAGIADASGFTVIEIPAAVFSEISDTGNSQGITAVCPIPVHSLSSVFSGGTVLVLDGVADPGNAGTAVRSAAAFDCSGIVFLKGSAFPWSPKVTRAAAGLNSFIPIFELEDLRGIREKFPDYLFYGASMNGKSMKDSFASSQYPVCIVVGSETHGLSQTTTSLIDSMVSIPMKTGIESLNAGVSASILLSALFTGKNS